MCARTRLCVCARPPLFARARVWWGKQVRLRKEYTNVQAIKMIVNETSFNEARGAAYRLRLSALALIAQRLHQPFHDDLRHSRVRTHACQSRRTHAHLRPAAVAASREEFLYAYDLAS